MHVIRKGLFFIRGLSGNNNFVKRESMDSRERKVDKLCEQDFFLEAKNTVTKGMVHKYKNRALVLLTTECASYCRFCTRKKFVGNRGVEYLTKSDIDKMEQYLIEHKEICDIIFSGGDPLMAQGNLLYALGKFIKIPHIKFMRIDTRMPVSNPGRVTDSLINNLSRFNEEMPLYIVIHFEHPDELCKETIDVIKKFRKNGFSMFSQSVFLKGINDSFETLYKLFQSLIAIGVKPYYIYHCDNLAGNEGFMVPIKKEIEIMTKIRNNCSGIAYPLHVICVPGGYGKVIVPTNHWRFDDATYRDFCNSIKKI